MSFPFFWFFIPFISAFIGWFTNFVTIKLLFRPYEERKVFFFRLQGIFPKRRAGLTEKLAVIVSECILNTDGLLDRINQNENLDSVIMEHVKIAVHNIINNKIKQIPLVSSFISGDSLKGIENMFISDLQENLKPAKEKLFKEIIVSLKLREAVTEYLNLLSMKELEDLIHSVLRKEFKFIELSGAVLGFIIGIIQLGIILW